MSLNDNNHGFQFVVTRMVPAGGTDPAIGKPSDNLEELLADWIKFHRKNGFAIPVEWADDDEKPTAKTSARFVEKFVLDPSLVCGTLLEIDEKTAKVQMFPDHVPSAMSKFLLHDLRLVVNALGTETDDNFHALRIAKLVLAWVKKGVNG